MSAPQTRRSYGEVVFTGDLGLAIYVCWVGESDAEATSEGKREEEE